VARIVRNASLATRTARASLKIKTKPYWQPLTPRLALGYRKASATGGQWTVRIYLGGRKYRVSTVGTADDFLDADGAAILSWEHAQERARGLLIGAAQPTDGATGPATVATVMAAYLAKLEGRGGRSYSDTKYRVDALILPALGTTPLAALTTETIRTWHRGLAASPGRLRTPIDGEQRHREASNDPEWIRRRQATANRVLVALRAGLNRAWRDGLVASDAAWRRVKPFAQVDVARVRYLTIAEAQRLLNAAEPDFRNLIAAAIQTGCRYSELIRLEVADFNPDVDTLTIRKSKPGKVRHTVLTEEGVQLFAGLSAGRAGDETMLRKADGEPWGHGHQTRPMLDTCARAKITPAINFHGLRHTWASLAVMAGMPLLVVAKNLGHADTRMVEKHYGHLAASYVAETTRQFAPRFGMSRSNIRPLA
jgi:integrase